MTGALVGSGDAFALVDPGALRRVVTALVDNAVRFTEQGGVLVTAEPRDGVALVRVADTGRGIGAAFLSCLFEPFRQESDGPARSHEGSGLGLAVAHRPTAAKGSVLCVESTPGVGSTFTLRLPTRPPGVEAPLERKASATT